MIYFGIVSHLLISQAITIPCTTLSHGVTIYTHSSGHLFENIGTYFNYSLTNNSLTSAMALLIKYIWVEKLENRVSMV